MRKQCGKCGNMYPVPDIFKHERCCEKTLKHPDLFSGIGGFAIATEMVWKYVEHTFCDIEPFSQAVLKKHWPDSYIYEDIKKLDGSSLGAVDLITGGFPCQPFSNAGKRKGTKDHRNLWLEMLRIIREVHPRWIIGENVDGLVTWDGGMVLESILTDLENEGYGAQPFIIPAAAVEAPHRRDRIWIVAHTNSSGCFHRQAQKLAAKAGEHALSKSFAGSDNMAHGGSLNGKRRNSEKQKIRKIQTQRPARLRSGGNKRYTRGWAVEPDVGRVAHGIPNRVDRIKSLGNAIVPQVAAEIMRAIREVDDSIC